MRDRWRRFFRIGDFRSDAGRDLDEELAFHAERTVEELVARGWEEDAARREAARRFGDREYWLRQIQRIDRGRTRMEGRTMWMADRWEDVRATLRGLARRPGFTAGVVATFALGIGANAALFGIVDRLLLRPPAHVVEAEDVAQLYLERDFIGRRIRSETMAFDDFLDFTRVDGFASVAAYSAFGLTLGEGEGARRLSAMFASAELFPLLGVTPHLGRFYGPDEDQFGAPLVAVLGYELWRSQFGSDPEVLGSQIRLAGASYTVVGVAPRGFTGIGLGRVDAWLPMRPAKVATDGSDIWFSGRGYNFVRVVVRLDRDRAEPATLAEATAVHLAGRSAQIEAGHYDAQAGVVADPVTAVLGEDATREGRVALWLAGVSALVLLIACANVTNLLLARSLRQRRESAVRLALGISPWRLVQLRVLDALVLAGIGGLVGLGVALLGGSALRQWLLPNIDWAGASDLRLALFTAVVSVLAGLVAALGPAAMAARRQLAPSLVEGARGSAAGGRMRGALTLSQATLATVLLVGAGLFVRSLSTARDTDIGFDVDRIVNVDLEPSSSLSGVELKDYYRRGAERLMAVPGVQAVAYTNAPFGWSFSGDLRAEGLDSIPLTPTGGPYYHRVGEGYFEAMGLQLLRGRGLEPTDVGGPPVAVINETMAELLWPGESALGRCLYVGSDDPPCSQVVGVTAYANRGSFQEERSPQYYLPMTDADDAEPRALVVRVQGDPDEAGGELARALHAELPGLRFVRVRTMRSLLDPEFRGWRLGVTVFTLFGALALVLAAVGLYSLLSFDVAERRKEIGIRMTLGSSVNRVRRDVFTRALVLVGGGVFLGLGAAWMIAPRVETLLFDVPARNLLVFAGTAAALLLTAAAAGAVPAWRATRVQPTEALRAE